MTADKDKLLTSLIIQTSALNDEPPQWKQAGKQKRSWENFGDFHFDSIHTSHLKEDVFQAPYRFLSVTYIYQFIPPLLL